MGSEKDQVVQYSEETSHFVYIDPSHRQTMNIFFMESTLSLKDRIWDIFDVSEYEVNIAEHSYSTRINAWMPPSM